MKFNHCLLIPLTFIFCVIGHNLLAQGTYPVFPNILDHSVGADAKLLGSFDDRLVYFDRVNDKNKLWVSNGTPEGTIQISAPDQTDINLIHYDNDAWYFTEQKGNQHYISKLTPGNDTLTPIHNSGIRYLDILYWNGKFCWIQRSAGSGYDRLQLYNPDDLTLLTLIDLDYLDLRGLGGTDSLIYFIASTDTGKMLGKSDGTIPNTTLFVKLFDAGSSFDQYTRFFSDGDQVFFFYNPENDPFILWTTDGTMNGTIQLGEYDSPYFGWEDDPYIFLGDKFFFVLRELGAPSGFTFDLHVSDGTPGGTFTFSTDPYDYMDPKHLTLFQNKVYFISGVTGGLDLRTADGTSPNTEVIIEAYGHETGGIGFAADVAPYENSLMVQAYTEALGFELYLSDGTTAGTALLSDVIRGSASSLASQFTQVGNRAFFTVSHANRNRLWIYDPDFVASCDSFLIEEAIIVPITDTTTTGSIQLFPAGGQQPYVYSLNGGAATGNSQFNNLPLGEHTVSVTDNLGCTTELTFEIEDITGIVEPGLLEMLSISPNPSNAEIGCRVQMQIGQLLRSDALTLLVYNSAGQMCFTDKLSIDSEFVQYHLVTRGLAPGQYTLSVMDDGRLAGSTILVLQ